MFKTLLFSALKRYRRMLISLSAGIFSFQVMMGSMFDSFAPIFSGGGPAANTMPDALNVFTGGASMFDPIGWLGVGFAHPIPIMLIVVWSLVVSANSVAKEIEDGTAELLYTRPVSRSTILGSRVAQFLIGLVVLLGASYLGSLAGIQLSDTLSSQVSQMEILKMTASYIPLAFLVAGLGFFISSAMSQKSSVISIVLGFVIVSYFLNFAGQLWDVLKDVVDYSIFYQTIAARWAVDDINGFALLIISIISVGLITASFLVLNRRNITV